MLGRFRETAVTLTLHRQDALDRHRRSRPPACIDVSPEMAAASVR
jgi:hypothetical protein